MAFKQDGGYAFPEHFSETHHVGRGMSLRDYFAAKALQAIVSQHTLNPCGDFVGADGLLQHYRAGENAATTAYKFADAMLNARESSDV